MLVGEWMSRDVVTVGVNDKISRVAALMSRLRIKQVPVLDGDKLAGLVTRSDLIRACPPDLNPFSLLGPIAEELAQPVRHFVATETVTVAPETPLEGAAHLLIARNINALPVVSAGKVWASSPVRTSVAPCWPLWARACQGCASPLTWAMTKTCSP